MNTSTPAYPRPLILSRNPFDVSRNLGSWHVESLRPVAVSALLADLKLHADVDDDKSEPVGQLTDESRNLPIERSKCLVPVTSDLTPEHHLQTS